MNHQESEALEAYKIYFDSYIKGDESSIASLLKDDYTQVGSAEAEVFFNKKDALQFIKDTIDQVAGKTSIQNRVLKTKQLEDYILVIDLFDIYVLTGDEWVFYSRFRASTLLQKIEGKWKFAYQHSSVPDLRTDGGENIGIEKIAAENLSLKDAIKRRTIELEQKNRELKIEASLERVRTVAMSMQQPGDMPDVCSTISTELQGLDITNTRNIQTAIFYETDGIYLNYEYFPLYDHKVVTRVEYNLQPDVQAFVNKMLQDPEAFFTTSFKGNELAEWIAYQQEAKQFVDPKLREVESLHYYFFSIGPGALGISTYAPLNEVEIAVFKRFRNVFELAYRRFVDIELAVAQAREARIEASLERVRAQAMSMRKSGDLLDVCEVVFSELNTLGFDELRNAMINIHDDEKAAFLNYDYSDDAGKTITHHLYNSHPVIEKQVKQIRTAEDAFSETVFTGKDLEEWKQFRKEKGEADDPKVDNLKALYYYFYSIGSGSIGISTYGSVSEEKRTLLKRFRNVFDLAYRRFQDIQLAEAQAREAKIELALERVRASAMAMQHSYELAELVTVVFKELTRLDFNITSCIIWINRPGLSKDELWVTSTEMDQPAHPIFFTPFYHPFFKSIIHAWKAKDPKWIFLLKGDEKKSFEISFFSEATGLPTALKSALTAPDEVVFSASFNNFGALEIIGTAPLRDEKFDILHRFGKVFDSSYTRFNDLKLAEAQAREAQIELALERVRARTMAMQKSDELSDTAWLFFEQFKELGESPDQITIGIIQEEKALIQFWITMRGSKMDKSVNASIHEPTLMHKLFVAWKENQKSLLVDLSGSELEAYFNFRNSLSQSVNIEPETVRDQRRIINAAFFSKGLITYSTSTPPPAESIRLLERFTGVFEQTYTRFLDLQKAEAQASEGRIELSLERVRASTMAMQKSEELKAVIQVVYEQFVHLNIPIEHTGFIIDYKANDDMHIWLADRQEIPTQVSIPYFDCAHWNSFKEAKEKGIDFFANHLGFEEKNKFYQDLFTLVPGVPDEAKEFYFNAPGLAISTVLLDNVGLYIENFSGTPYSDKENNTLMRFGKVFQQTYTRFLDLQKAEANATEAKIEASLERVRSRAMAMHVSQDLANTIGVFYHELHTFSITPIRSGVGILDREERVGELFTWNTTGKGKALELVGRLKMEGHPLLDKVYESWLSQNEYHPVLRGNQIKEYYNVLRPQIAFPNFTNEDVQYGYFFFFKEGGVYAWANKEMKEDELQIYRRFTSVLSLTYKRYRDLQQAEAQAREAQIEAALERVRSRSLAMHNSEEIKEVVKTVVEKIKGLDIEMNGGVSLVTFAPGSKDLLHWIWIPEQFDEPLKAQLPYFENIMFHDCNQARENGLELVAKVYSGEDKSKYFEHIFNHSGFSVAKDDLKTWVMAQEYFGFSFAIQQHSGIFLNDYTGKYFSAETNNILIRFSKVFEQAYVRFLDLQKAEAQAREAQIQLALERVRAKTMAMHKSDEIVEVMGEVIRKLKELDVKLFSANLFVFTEGASDVEVWTANPGGSNSTRFMLPIASGPQFPFIIDKMEKGEDLFAHSYTFEEKNIFFTNLFTNTNYRFVTDERKKYILESPGYNITVGISKNIALQLNNYSATAFTDEENDINVRFAKVFEQSYTRFLDLQKAEAQAREAKIEAALERVRSKTMAMHKSKDVTSATKTMFDELKKLGIDYLQCGVANIHNNRTFAVFGVTNLPGGNKMSGLGIFGMDEHPIWQRWFESWVNKEVVFMAYLSGKEKEQYFHNIQNHRNYLTQQIIHFPDNFFQAYYFEQGALWTYSLDKHSKPEKEVMERFARSFSLTFRRYQDLKKSEAEGIEAIKRASVDRVRAEIASMRTTNDLERITPIIWNELTTLGVPFIRCGVFIMDEEQQQVNTMLSTPDGKAIAAFHQPYDSPGDTAQVIAHWHKKEMYQQHWDENQFIEFTKKLVEQGAVTSGEKYLTENRPTNLYLHFLPFLQGMLYVGNDAPLNEDALQLVQNLADAFATAYARYEDFNKLESAKQQIEKTLVDLKQAQSQLVQSEKMASLGELTAGIAHEIQNPLNFVNNFSEVSNEMLDEMKTELATGNLQLATEIASDLQQNLEKILHHGKRADAIVKGMLQHSRSSSGSKESIDINALADEYLRLSYHGLRAKDKGFGATTKTDFDATIRNIIVIPPDMGRVLFNLYNNAFYAVTEKAKQGIPGYEPTVSVNTKKVEDKIIISVKDNGNGIPGKIADKIFQPFFTTKPTGQGTGLGLSLSYDIVKAHGGELSVETKEGEGSKFIIQLPVVL